MKTKEIDLLDYVKDIANFGKEAINFLNQKLPPEAKRPGCYLSVIDKTNGETIFTIRLLVNGNFLEEKANKYFNLARDKAKSIFLYQASGYYTSRETHFVESDGCPPGAILYGNHIIAISGQTADDDEALAVLVGIRFLPMPKDIQNLKIRVVENPRLPLLLEYILSQEPEFSPLKTKIQLFQEAPIRILRKKHH